LVSNFADVSVVIPCFKCGKTIKRAVHSVWMQTLMPKEIILVDDCSNDSTLESLWALQGDYPNGWLHVEPRLSNGGPGEARNTGWMKASGEFIAFLDSDDGFHPQKIEIQYRWMKNHPLVSLTGHRVQQLQESNDISGIYYDANAVSFHQISHERLLFHNRFSTPGVMIKRNLEERFESGKKYSEDYLLWLQISLSGKLCFYSEVPLAYIFKARYGDSGLSSNLWKMQKGEVSTYAKLREKKLITNGFFIVLFFYSIMKYFRRIVITCYKRWQK